MSSGLSPIYLDLTAHKDNRRMEPTGIGPQAWLSNLKHDVLASLVVFLVALPLCMAIAMASGMPPGAGLITGIIGGLVVGTFAGCPLQVSGPAAGLTVIVWQYVQTYGVEALGVIILAGGVLQILAGVLQLGQWFRAVSPAVIQGMLAGIGLLIFGSQFHVMIDDAPRGSGLANLVSLPEAVMKVMTSAADGSVHHLAASIGLLTIGAIVLWNTAVPKALRVIPALLVGVLLATLAAKLQELPISFVQVRDNPFTLMHLPTLESLAHLLDVSILSAALALAFIASAETLLSATAVDQMHAGPRTRYNKELMSQGVGNMLCGMLGALPMTGVIVRSSANVQAGARTRLSTILHGAWLLLFVAFLPFLLRWIPTASLAAVLVFTGYKLMNVQVIRELREHGRSEVLIYFGTLTVIVATNLLTGVLFGVGLALAKLVYTTQNLETHFDHQKGSPAATLHLMGVATFVSLPKLATALERVAPKLRVRVEFESLRHIDHACFHFLESWKKLHEANGGQVSLDWDLLKTRTYQVRHGRRPEGSAHPTQDPRQPVDQAQR